jgi:hypothetical protein
MRKLKLRRHCGSAVPLQPFQTFHYKTNVHYRIWSSQSGGAVDSSLLRYDNVSLDKLFLMFQRIAVPSSSGLKSPRTMLDPVDKGTMTLQNIRNHSPNNMASYFRRLNPSNALGSPCLYNIVNWTNCGNAPRYSIQQ